MELDEADVRALGELEQKQNHLRTAVRALSDGYELGLFVWGEGGQGKSYVVEETLKKHNAHYVLHNSRLTGRGLVDRLQAAPSAIHWVEDAETLFGDKNALGVIRSACWSQSDKRPPEREVTWGAYGAEIRFVFTGSLLIISNANLAGSSPELRAVGTRVKVLNMDVAAPEVFALMKTICQRGYTYGHESLTPGECWQVASFIKERMDALKRSLDLRLLKQGFRDYLLAKQPETPMTWQELLETRMKQRPTYVTPKQRRIEESTLAKEIYAMPLSSGEKERRWEEETGRNRATYYRALNR